MRDLNPAVCPWPKARLGARLKRRQNVEMHRPIHKNIKSALSAVCLFATGFGHAEEAKLSQVETALSQTVLSGYISTSANLDFSRDGNCPSYLSADHLDVQSVPEPSSMALLSIGLASVMLACRWRTKQG